MADINSIRKSLDKNEIYRTLFRTASEGLVVIDNTGSILLTNPRLLEMFGYQEEEDLIGKKIECLIPPRYKGHISLRKNFIENPHNRPMGQGRDLLALRNDGTEFPIEVSLNVCHILEEPCVMGLLTDITERKKAEKNLQELNADLEKRIEARTRELQKSQQLYEAIARNFPDGTINVFDKDLNYVFAEGKELYRLGITSKRLIGTPFRDRLPEEIRDNITKHLLGIFEGKADTIVISIKGQHYVLDAVPLQEADGSIQQILVVEKNITKQKNAEEEIQRALRKEKELNELKSRFVSMASHEFRTPLSTILSSATLAQRYQEPTQAEKRNKHLLRIRSSVQNLTSILNDFLSLDKLETGKIEANYAEFNFKELAEDLIETLEPVCREGQEIRLQYEGGEEVNLDPHMAKNICLNLLSNAIKYSPEQKPIDFSLSNRAEGISIEVRDYGLGIPEEEQNHMFERFFRAKNVTNIQGTGLGLNIVKKYLDLMGGSIRFKSKEGEGTVFFIDIPNQKT